MLRPLIGLAGCRTLTVNSPYKAFPSSRRGVQAYTGPYRAKNSVY